MVRRILYRRNPQPSSPDSPCWRLALTSSAGAAMNTTSYAYDVMGRISEMTNALGNVTFIRYDLRGNRIHEGGATYPVDYAYDVHGNRTSMTTYRDESSGSGDTTTWNYDEASGLVTNKVYADGNGPTYAYDAQGRLTRRTWARGVTTDYAYDGWGNMTNTVYSDGTPTITFAYDAMGHRTSVTDAAGTTSFAYDDYGSVTNELVVSLNAARRLEHYYDQFGRDTGYSLDEERRSTLAYETATGRISSMLSPGSTTPFMWSYDADTGRKSGLAYPNGVSAQWSYDARGNLVQVRNGTTGQVVSQFDYTWISEIVGNAETPSFDLDGNQTLVTTKTGTWTVSYNGENRPVLWSNGVTNIVMAYDNMGRWVSCDTYIGNSIPRESKRFSYNGYLLVHEERQTADSPQENIACDYVWDPTEPVATRPLVFRLKHGSSQSNVMYYTHDGNKNVSELILSTGTVVAHYEYSPFGSVTVFDGQFANDNLFRFSSEYADDVQGLTYFNYRQYDGDSGRWLIRDPIMELGGIGLYGYLGNNASGFNDSLGLKLLPRRDPRYEKSKQIKGTPKYQLFVSHFDVDLYEKAFRNFKNTLDKVISKLEECCSKEGLKGDKICDAILSNEEIPIYLKMYVRTQQFTVKYSNACGGGGPYIEYIEGYDMKSGELRPPFPYLGEDGREYPESYETLLFHELAHYLRRTRPEILPKLEELSKEEEAIWGMPLEKEAIQEENRLRKCCLLIEDKMQRSRFTKPKE